MEDAMFKTGEEAMFRTDTVEDDCRLCMEDAYGGGSDV